MTDPSIADLARLAEIVRGLSDTAREAWIRCGRRMAAGMPAGEAEALLRRELADAGSA